MLTTDDVGSRHVANDMALLENAILQRISEGWNEASGNVLSYQSDMEAWWQMYLGIFAPDGAREGPFEDLYLAKAAPAVDRLVAGLLSSNVPDPSAQDWFQCLAQPTTDNDLPPETLSQYALWQEASLRRSLIVGGFDDVLAQAMLDLVVVGNCYLMESYEEENKIQWQYTPNPLYSLDPISLLQAPGGPYTLLDGWVVKQDEFGRWQVVDKQIKSSRVVRTFADPKTSYLNPFNVFPAELDRNGLEHCSGVYVYDACNPRDLIEDAIMVDSMGIVSGNYANLGADPQDPDNDGDSIMDEAESYIPAVYNSLGGWGATGDSMENLSPAPRTVMRVARQTYYGQFDLDDVCERAGVPRDSAAMQALYKKFNVDPDRAAHMKTWVIETVGRNMPDKVIRFQPNPYDHDEIPIVHHRLVMRTNQTLGIGLYGRVELFERIYNYFMRQGLEHSQRLSNPPVVAFTDNIDPAQIEELGGLADLPPGIVLRGIDSRMEADPIRAVKLPADGLEFSRQATDSLSMLIDESSMVPATASGQLPGVDVKAKAIGLANQGADALFLALANRVAAFLVRLLRLKNKVQRQYCREQRSFVLKGSDGKPVQYDVPPEAMDCEALWFAAGPNSLGNREMKIGAMETATKVLAEGGRLDFEAYGKWLATTLHDANFAALVAPPPQPDPPSKRMTGAVTVDISKCSAEIAVPLLTALSGVDFGPNAIQAQSNTARILAGREAVPLQAPQPEPPQLPAPEATPDMQQAMAGAPA